MPRASPRCRASRVEGRHRTRWPAALPGARRKTAAGASSSPVLPVPPLQANHGNRLSRDAFAASCKTKPFRRCRLDADSRGIQFEYLRDARAHCVSVRADLRPLADKSDIEIADDAAACGQHRCGMTQEERGTGTTPLRIRGWEMLAGK